MLLAQLQQHLCSQKENELDDDPQQVLLAITVEIDDGCVEHIEMRAGDSPEAVAMKFCLNHGLPEQFVAPLAEHIASNIISLSKEANGKDECHSYEEEWPTCAADKGASDCIQPDESDWKTQHARPCGHIFRSVNFPLSRSKDANKMGSGRAHLSPLKTRQNYMRKNVSGQLIAPTLTSLAKLGSEEQKREDTLKSVSTCHVPHQANAVCIRLYTEFVRRKLKLEEDKKHSLELYQEKLGRDRTRISKESWRIMRMRGCAAKQYRNYGELLYTEGLIKKKTQMKLMEQKQKNDEARELAQLTLMPEISKQAKNMRQKQGQVWKRLLCQEKPRQDQLEELWNELWETKLKECTFKPQIIHRRIGHGRREDMKHGSCNRFELLFMDAESRCCRQAQYMQWYPEGVTFQPAINRRKVERLDMDGDNTQEETVFDRLLQYASKLTEKKKLQEQLARRPIDPNTGRMLFRPHTGRKPQSDRNPVHLPIWEFLYRMKSALDSKLESLAERDQKLKRDQANCHYVGPKSQKLLGQKGAKVHSRLKHKDHTDHSSFTHQFEMDHFSRNLATRRRKFHSNGQWYKLICMDREERQRKVEEMCREKQDMEMVQCTFRPELFSRGTRKESQKATRGQCDTIPSIVQKVQEEVHGFYLQDDQGPESWKRIMSDSLDNCQAVGTSSLPLMKQPNSSSPSYLSALDDLPEADVKKHSLFFGIMGV
ncbi:unnamed protein product [Sphagnum balticum]